MKAMSMCLLHMKKKVAKVKKEKRFMLNGNLKLRAFAQWKGVKSTRTGDSFIETIPPMYLEFALHHEKASMLYYCKKTILACSFYFWATIESAEAW